MRISAKLFNGEIMRCQDDMNAMRCSFYEAVIILLARWPYKARQRNGSIAIFRLYRYWSWCL